VWLRVPQFDPCVVVGGERFTRHDKDPKATAPWNVAYFLRTQIASRLRPCTVDALARTCKNHVSMTVIDRSWLGCSDWFGAGMAPVSMLIHLRAQARLRERAPAAQRRTVQGQRSHVWGKPLCTLARVTGRAFQPGLLVPVAE
jgi:hypothetical protein